MFKRLKQNQIYEKIANQILEAIFRGDLKPGDKLQSENELSKTFGVSRVTIREALQFLKQLGVIEVRQGAKGGAYVKKIDLDNVASQMQQVLQISNIPLSQLSEVRAILEELIITQMLKSGVDDVYINKMEQTIVEAEKYLKENNQKKRLAANIKFHTIIAEMTENSLIILMHKITLNMLYGFFLQVKPSDSMAKKTIQQHKQIVKAFKEKDFQQASEICAKHIQQVSELITIKSKEQSVFKPEINKEA